MDSRVEFLVVIITADPSCCLGSDSWQIAHE